MRADIHRGERGRPHQHGDHRQELAMQEARAGFPDVPRLELGEIGVVAATYVVEEGHGTHIAGRGKAVIPSDVRSEERSLGFASG